MENFNILEQKQNPLFKRKEIKFILKANVTPSHAIARKIIAEKFSIPEENIRLKNILGKFGSKSFTISANIYESEQDKLNIEGQSKKDANAQPETPKEEPAPEAAPEAPIEENKSEEKVE